MVIKHRIALKGMCILCLLFASCGSKFVSFDEYIKNSMLDDEEIYPIYSMNYKVRLVYTGAGTHFNYSDSPNGNIILSKIKYYTEVIPLAITSLDGNKWVKIEVKDIGVGWIESKYLEIHKKAITNKLYESRKR